MIKRFCDGCGDAMKDDARQHEIDHNIAIPGRGVVNVKVRITRAVAGVWNDGDLCLTCLREVVADGKIQAAVTP